MRRLTALLLILLLVTLAACGGGDDDQDKTPVPSPTPAQPTSPPVPLTATPTPTATPLSRPATDTNPATQAELRIVHASADLPAVDIYLDGATIGEGFTLGQQHVNPLSFRPGTYRLRVVTTGENPDVADLFLDQSIELESQHSLIAILSGAPDSLKLIPYEENLDPVPAATARVTFIQAVPRGPGVSVQVANQTLVQDVYFGTVEEPVQVEASLKTFDMVSGPETLASVDLNLMERHAYTLILVGEEGGGGYSTISFHTRAYSASQVRVLHASPDLPPVDVYLNDSVLVENLALDNASEWSTVASLSYMLSLRPAGKPTAEPLVQKEVTLTPDKALDLVLLDSVERLRVLSVEEDLSPTPINGTRLIFVQAAVEAIQVTIRSLGGEIPGLRPISFGTATQPLSYTSGEEAFYFSTGQGESEREVDFLPAHDWLPGYVYTIVITGYPNSEPLVAETEVGLGESFIADEGIVAIETPGAFEAFGLRMINALPDDTPLALEIDDLTLFQDVLPGQDTVYFTLANPPSRIVIRNSETEKILLQEDTSWPGSVNLTLFVFQDESGIRYELGPDMAFVLADGEAYLRVFHAAPNKAGLQVFRQEVREDSGLEEPEATPVFEDIPLSLVAELGLPTDPQIILAGAYDVQIRESATGILVDTLPETTFESGVSYDLLILPDDSGLGIWPRLIAHTR